MESPLLSIVVPTKDRYFYLKRLILLLDSFSFDSFEMVIQDNTKDNSEILCFLENHHFAFVKYFHTAEQLSVSKNSDLAILHSSGEYVCFIGDDDGVSQYILDCVVWMKRNNIDALRQEKPIFYYWPDYCDLKYKLSGSLSFEMFTQNAYLQDPLSSYERLANRAFADLSGMPRVYNGIVRRVVLDEIYRLGNTFFPGPSPDMANAVALCFFVEKFVIVDFPIIIAGACKSAGGGARLLKNLIGKIEDQPFLPTNIKNVWDKRIPYLWASETIWPESAIEALRYVGRDDLIDKINFNKILARFFIYHKRYFSDAFHLASNKLGFIWWTFSLCSMLGWKYMNRYVSYLISKKIEGRITYKNVEDIVKAHKLLAMRVEKVIARYPNNNCNI